MKLTVLFDLDDTLFGNNMNAFLPLYLQGLGTFMSEKTNGLPPELIIRKVMGATQKMLEKTDPGHTLEEVFDQHFYPAIGSAKELLREEIDSFYQNIFPAYKSVTRPRPKAVEAVQYCLEQEHRVVIATNPLFPKQATYQRLTWAGLPLEEYSFDLVTTYEHFHACKPHPTYYAEILGQLGWPDGGVIVIGDSLEDEILPANELGIPGFWINGDPARLSQLAGKGLHPSTTAGTVDDLLPWIKEMENTSLEMVFNRPNGVLAVLKSIPGTLDTLLSGHPDSVWNTRPHLNEWSVTEILCHLRDTDQEVNWPRFLKVCEEENPFIPGMVTDPWADERDYRNQDGRLALKSFTEIRTQISRLLERIPEYGWQRKARHAIFGPTTMVELTGFTATHDRTHVRQALDTIRAVTGVSEPE